MGGNLSKSFWKEDDEDGFIRSMGDGYLSLRFPVPPSNRLINLVLLRQFDLDLVWYKLKDAGIKSEDGVISPIECSYYGTLKTSPLIIKTARTKWLFESYEIDETTPPEIIVLISEEAESGDLVEKFGESVANVVMTIKQDPEIKKLIGLR